MIKLRRTFSLSPAGLGGIAPLAALVIPLVGASCFFATKQDIDRLQADIVGTRASTSAADSVQRVQLIEVSRSVRTLSDSISVLSRRLAAMRTASESDMTAMRENIAQLQDLSGQSEQRLRDMRATLEEKRQQQEASPTIPDTTGAATTPATGPGPLQLLGPATHLSRQKPVGVTEVVESDRRRVHFVEVGQGVDQLMCQRSSRSVVQGDGV